MPMENIALVMVSFYSLPEAGAETPVNSMIQASHSTLSV